jgi:hypothetical protein
MDTKIIRQYGEDILCYRLRTARHKKRMQYEDFEKKLIGLYKEERALYKQIRELGWEPLIPPVQKGWKRFFVLRDDVARSRHAAFFQNILKKINTYDWSYRKDFMIRKRKFGRKKYVVKEQRLLKPWECHFKKLDFNEYERQMFHEEYHYRQWSKGPIKRYVFNEPWRFVLKVRTNMITKTRVTDAILESRLEWINNYMERNDLRKKQAKLMHGNYEWKDWRNFEKYNEVNMFKNKSLQQIMDMIKE